MAVTGFFGLFSLLMLWNTILAPTTHFPIGFVLLAVVTPILIPFRGLLNADLKSCTWMGYLSLFYLTHGIAEAYLATDEQLYALLEVFFSLLLCAGASFFVYTAEKNT